jgi:hypothetical protein
MNADLLDKLLKVTMRLAEMTAALHRERVVIAKQELDQARESRSSLIRHYEERCQSLTIRDRDDEPA